MSKSKRYDQKDDQITRAAIADGVEWDEIGRRLGRSGRSVKERIQAIKDGRAASKADLPEAVRRDCNICGRSVMMRDRYQRFCSGCRAHKVHALNGGLNL